MQTWAKPISDWKQILSQAPKRQPNTSWNVETYITDYEPKAGFNEYYLVLTIDNSVRITLNPTIYWKSDFSESKSETMLCERNGAIYHFQIRLRPTGLAISFRKTESTSTTLNWISIWQRDTNIIPDIL